jgi:2-amino-4-hydroxy-6-hydroxymethyldihydropteridine diphosphokinase
MVTAYVALGANLGDAHAALRRARAALESAAHSRVIACSSIYKTPALGDDGVPMDPPSPDYLNAVLALETLLSAQDLLGFMQAIENAAGRQRPYRLAPRTLDLDLLRFGSLRSDKPSLTLPHPRMMSRAFVLLPLAEIAPEQVTPAELAAVQGQLIQRLGPLEPLTAAKD